MNKPPRAFIVNRRVANRVWMAPVLAAILVCLSTGTGCSPPPEPEPFVARVGNAKLTEAEIADLLQDRSAFLDSADAVSQIVEQWVTNELLYQEALSRGLRGDPDVRTLLSDNERSVLIDALVTRFLDTEIGEGPDEAAIQTYYEQHRDQLVLREPYVRIRHRVFTNPDSAEFAQQALNGLPLPDSGATDQWNTSGIQDDVFYPEAHVFAASPGLNMLLRDLSPGDVRLVSTPDSSYHVVQLLDRMTSGTVPDREMVRETIRERLTIEMRKQLYARQVERLRTRALAREELVVK
jgi:hypothetical protein